MRKGETQTLEEWFIALERENPAFHSLELDKKPLVIGLDWIWDAYQQLGSCRIQPGGPIPLPAVWAYADRWGLWREERELLELAVAAMDAALSAYQAEKTQEEKDKAKQEAARRQQSGFRMPRGTGQQNRRS
jgi:hypothetical protein